MLKEVYTVKDMETMFGIERECLRSWMKKGCIKPSVQYSAGPGRAPENKHLFSVEDVGYIFAFKKLVELGVSTKLAKKILA